MEFSTSETEGEGFENETWDYYLSKIEQQNDIDDTEKQELNKKWVYLREILGENWFKEEINKIHPLKSYFYNSAPWRLRWIGELGEAIKSLKEKENFEDILNRLLSAEAFEEAYYELRVGYSLFKLDVSFEFLRPSKKKKEKTPDIVIKGDREIFLEITKMNNPEDPLNSSQNIHKISWLLSSKCPQIGNDYSACFEILKPLSTPRTEQILNRCENLFEKVKKSGFEEFHIPKTIDLYIYKIENIDKVPKEKRVMQGKIPDFDELSRIRGTIKTKQYQLVSKQPNVLLIFDSLLWLGSMENKELFYSKLMDTLEETVNQFTNLSAVIIYIEIFYLMDDESFVKEGRNYIAIQKYDEKFLRSKSKVIILNEFADNPLLPQEIEVFKNI